jgi:hypothetical protein
MVGNLGDSMEREDGKSSEKKPYITPSLKTYRTPKLSDYGDVRQLTRAIPSGMGADDGGGGSHKTSP